MIKKLLASIIIFSAISSVADTPANSIVKIRGGTDGTIVGNISDAAKVYVTNPGGGTQTVNQGTPNAGGVNSWYVQGALGRTWTFSYLTDSVTSNQGGIWNVGRTWTLSSGSDSVTSFQGAGPWSENLVQIAGAVPSVTNTLPIRISNGTIFVDPTQIRSLSSTSDSITTVPSGTQTVTVSSGTIVATQPTGSNLHTVTDSGSVTSATVTNPATNYSLESGGHLASIDSKLADLHTLTQTGTSLNVNVTGGVSGNASIGSNNATAPSSSTQIGGQDSGGKLQALQVDASKQLLVNNSANTQPTSSAQLPSALDGSGNLKVHEQGTAAISAASLPLPANAAQETGGHLASIDTKLTSPLTTNATLQAGSAIVGKVGIDQTTPGTTNGVVVNSGTLTANVGTTGGLQLDTTGAKLNNAQGSTTSGQTGPLVQGAVTTAAPTYTTGQTSPLSLTTAGALRTDSSGTTQTIAGSVNVSQFGGNNVVTGVGNSGSGIPRVTVSSDSIVNSKTQDGAGNSLTSQASGSQRAIDTGIDVAGVQIDPRQTRALTSSDTVTVVQPTGTNLHTVVDSGTVTANLGTIAGVATAANQTNGTQKTQNVDGTGAVNGPYTVLGGTTYLPVVQASSATPGSAVPARSTVVAGSDGTNAQTLSTDTTGKLNINNISGNVSLPTGAATASNQTTVGSQTTKINDGTNTAAVKAASTSPAVADPSLVVALSPNGNQATAANQTTGNSSLATIVTNTTGLATSANQTNASQKTQIVDGSGNVNTSSTFNSKVGMSSVISGEDILTVTGTGSALNGDAIAATDVAAYKCAYIQLVVTGTNTTTFQNSEDNFTNTFSDTCTPTTSTSSAATATAAATGHFQCPITGRYFRARVTAFTSGSSAGTATFSPFPCSTDLGQRTVLATENGTFTVNSNPAVQVFGAQVASAARTTSANSGNLTQASPNNQAVFELNVTAVSGTNPTLDLVFQESPDGGTTWVDEWHWERVTATGQFYTPNLVMNTNHFRFAWTIAGTTPSFTFSVSSNQGNQIGQMQRRFFDRTISLSTLNSTTPSFLTDGCLDYSFTVSDSACTTFPTVALQTSEDNSNWATSGLTLPTTTNGTFVSSSTQVPGHFTRLIVTTPGTTCSTGYVALRCTQY